MDKFNEEAYINELTNTLNIDMENSNLIDLLIVLKKYQGNTLVIEFEGSLFCVRNTIQNYLLELALTEQTEIQEIVIKNEDAENVFIVSDIGVESFRRLYNEYPEISYLIKYKHEQIKLQFILE